MEVSGIGVCVCVCVCVCVFVCVAEGPADGLTAAVFTGSTAQASERGMIGNGLNEIKLLSA